MSACERYQVDLSALLDGELDAERETALRAHMADCPDCQALYDAFSLLHADVQEPPADLTARIMDAVRAEGETNITPMPKKKNRHWGAWLAAAACFVVIVGAAVLPRLTDAGTLGPANAAARTISHPEADGEDASQAEGAAAATADAAVDAEVEKRDTNDGLVAASAPPMTLTDADQISAVRALLTDPAEDVWHEDAPPVLVLQEDETATAIYLDGDDVCYSEDGEVYYRCVGAANALIDLLATL